MNVTELARKLKVNPQELREMLPRMGFHVGQKAIKVDPKTAQRIISQWPSLIKELKAKDEKLKKEEKEEEIKKEDKKIIPIPAFIIIRDFAEISNIPINKVLKELMNNGVFASMNEKIDFETAAIIGDSLGLEVKLDEKSKEETGGDEKKIDEVLKKEDKNKLATRPPVIVVMGHVDHGKTKLLDAIRRTDVVAGEHGGITQHIGAYQVTRKKRLITFIDTPGHEAFTAMRSRGARIADVAILIVAADDGVKPQTVEAFNIIKAAGIPFVVAINKIDKPEADINKTKQELSTQLGITPEDWGGKTICVPISAKAGTGIDEILDMLLLVADTETKNIKANPTSQAIGTIIESHVDKNTGPVATILIQNGTLKIGDQLCTQGNICGKVRALKDYTGENIKEAPPSTPAKIIGLKIAPTVGDILEVGEGKRVKGKLEKLTKKSSIVKINGKEDKNAETAKKINLIIKSDVLGSAEAIEESLMKINTEEVQVKIINKGLGNIIEGDIDRAEGTSAEIIGFNIKMTPQIETLAREKNIQVHIFNVIYDLIEYVKGEMQKLIIAKIEKVNLGRLKVLAIFKTGNKDQIVGGKVLDGQIKNNVWVEIMRDKELIETGKITRLQAGKQDVELAEKNQECGIEYQGNPIIQEGDILKFFEEKKTISKL